MADPAYIVDGVLTDGEAWVGIATTTLGSDTALITFTSPDDGSSTDWSQFMDLVVVMYGHSAAVGYNSNDVTVTFNNVTTSSYAYQTLIGNGTSASAASGTTTSMGWGEISGVNSGTTNFSCIVAHLFDINSGKYKSVLTQSAGDRDGSGQMMLKAFTFQSQAPLTEMDIAQADSKDYTAGSMFSLFGILPRMVA